MWGLWVLHSGSPTLAWFYLRRWRQTRRSDRRQTNGTYYNKMPRCSQHKFLSERLKSRVLFVAAQKLCFKRRDICLQVKTEAWPLFSQASKSQELCQGQNGWGSRVLLQAGDSFMQDGSPSFVKIPQVTHLTLPKLVLKCSNRDYFCLHMNEAALWSRCFLMSPFQACLA